MVHRNFSFSFRAPIARLLSSKQYAKAGMLGTTDKMAYPFSLPTDRKGRIVETLSAFEWKKSQEVSEIRVTACLYSKKGGVQFDTSPSFISMISTVICLLFLQD